MAESFERDQIIYCHDYDVNYSKKKIVRLIFIINKYILEE